MSNLRNQAIKAYHTRMYPQTKGNYRVDAFKAYHETILAPVKQPVKVSDYQD